VFNFSESDNESRIKIFAIVTQILCIETSSEFCSVALFEDGELLGHRSDSDSFSHASKLTVLIEQLLNEFKLTPDAVAVSSGPGSYTGLRIGTSTAKGLAYGFGIPLISVDTLKLIAHSLMLNANIDKDEFIIPLIDARRMEVYTAVYSTELVPITPPYSLILTDNSFGDLNKQAKVHFTGTGSAKAEGILNIDDARFYSDLGRPNAKFMGRLAFQKFTHNEFEDVAYFEPFYLKEFHFTKGKS
jgi:tRNA threonylcarbamoyladenosine biosynthesis protein TsaB